MTPVEVGLLFSLGRGRNIGNLFPIIRRVVQTIGMRFAMGVRLYDFGHGFSQIVVIVFLVFVGDRREKVRYIDDKRGKYRRLLEDEYIVCGVDRFRIHGIPQLIERAYSVYPSVRLDFGKVAFANDAGHAVKELQDLRASDRIKHLAVYLDAKMETAFLETRVFVSPSPEIRIAVDHFKIASLDDDNSTQGGFESVIVLDKPGGGFIIKEFMKGDGVHVIEDEIDVLVVMGISLFDGEESNVFDGAAIEGSFVGLMREIDFAFARRAVFQ